MKTYLSGAFMGLCIMAALNTIMVFALYEKPQPVRDFVEIAYHVCPEVDMDTKRLTVADIEEMIQ